MASFRKSINLSDTNGEEDVIFELCSNEEQINMVALAFSSDEFFYIHLLVIYDLEVLVLFTLFEYEVLMTINVVFSQISPYR